MPLLDVSRDIRDTRYVPRSGRLPVEAFTLSSLRRRVDLAAVGAERLHFHLVLVGLDGSGEHEVDFGLVPVEPLRLVHVRPGQVHRWLQPHAYEAQLVLLPDDAPLQPPATPDRPPSRLLTPDEWLRCAALPPLLDDELRHEQPPEARDRALHALRDLLVVRLGIDRPGPADSSRADAGSSPLPPPYVALRAELEAHPTPLRSVAELAAALGYAPRTLTRACLAATGRTAKQVVDERGYLEARRLLVHTDRPVRAVAAQLGFTEPTNFTKFFVRMSGSTPGRWRSGYAAGGGVRG